jgi:hypothetical protein
MGGGLMQLVAYGAQDIYLTGNPQITFFKVVYRRHTNFSIETINQTFNSSVDFGRKSTVTISRNADLISKMYLSIKLPKIKQVQSTSGDDSTYVTWTNGIGNAMIKSISIEIGGQEIDKHYGEWLDIWHELNLSEEHKRSYNKMVNNNMDEGWTAPKPTILKGDELTLYVPLIFWFNRNPGLALPLIALQYHEVKLNLEIENSSYLIRNDKGNITTPLDSDGSALAVTSCDLLVDYIYLDTDERRRFAQVSHEYLIEQLQFTGTESIEQGSTNLNLDLSFNHPVKYIHWVIQDGTYTNIRGVGSKDYEYNDELFDGGNQKLRYGSLLNINDKYDTFKTAKLQLNGHDRFAERDADYFRLVQNFQHLPGSSKKYIYTYSFCLKPNEHQPSGSCNFSRIDSAKLNITFDTTSVSINKKNSNTPAEYYTGGQVAHDSTIKIYAVNYNVLRIMSGMGGLAYSN